MTPRERVLIAMRRGVPDRVPYELHFTPPMLELFQQKTGATDPATYWTFAERWVGFDRPSTVVDYTAYYPEGLSAGATINEWGIAETPGSRRRESKTLPTIPCPISPDPNVGNTWPVKWPKFTSTTWPPTPPWK